MHWCLENRHRKIFSGSLKAGKEAGMRKFREARHGIPRSRSSSLVLPRRNQICPGSHSSFMIKLKRWRNPGLPSFLWVHRIITPLITYLSSSFLCLRQEGPNSSLVILQVILTSQGLLPSHEVFLFPFLWTSQRNRPYAPNCRVPFCLIEQPFYHFSMWAACL